MPVGNFDDQGRFVVKLDVVHDFRELPAELFGEKDNADFFVGNGTFQSFF